MPNNNGLKETLEFVPNEDKKRQIAELMAQGFGYVCLDCHTVYKSPPQESGCSGGHGVQSMDMCRCGSDIFEKLEKVSCLKVVVKPVRGNLVFKKHHFKYCKCAVGEVWTGDADTECGAEYNLKLLGKRGDAKVFKCLKSGLTITILKSTRKEMTSPDERGCKYLCPIPTGEYLSGRFQKAAASNLR